jgi:predicted Zn-dependent protease
MSPAEASAARPFRIRVLRAGAGDTQETMARRMAVADLPLRRFQVLNGLDPGEPLRAGRRYKVIAD